MITADKTIEILKAYRDQLKNSPSNQLDIDIEAFDYAIRAVEEKNERSKMISSGYAMGWSKGWP